MRRLILMLLIVVLAACSGDDQEAPRLSSGGNGGNNGTSTDTNEAPPPSAAPEISSAGLSGTLIYYQSGQLKRLWLGESEPVTMAEFDDGEAVYLSPDRRHMLFVGEVNRDRFVFLMDPQGGQHTELIQLFSFDWRPVLWSPDGEWVVLSAGRRGHDLARLDGTVSYELGHRRATFFWLSDDRLLILDFSTSFREGEEIQTYQAAFIANTSGEITPLDWDMEAMNADMQTTLETELAALDVEITASPVEVMQFVVQDDVPVFPVPADGAFRGSGISCQSWQLIPVIDFQNGDFGTPLYVADSVSALSDLLRLEDESILFLEWLRPDCESTALPQGNLMRLPPDSDEAQILATGVYEGISIHNPDFNFFGNTPRLFAPSPDQRHVVYVGGGLASQKTSLHLVDLENQETTLLYEEPVVIETGTAIPFITAVFWLDAEPDSP